MAFLTINGVNVRVPDQQARRMEPMMTGGGVRRAIDMTPRATTATNIKHRFQVTTIELDDTEYEALVAAIGLPGTKVPCNGYMFKNVETPCFIKWTETYHHVASTTTTNHVLEIQLEVA